MPNKLPTSKDINACYSAVWDYSSVILKHPNRIGRNRELVRKIHTINRIIVLWHAFHSKRNFRADVADTAVRTQQHLAVLAGNKVGVFSEEHSGRIEALRDKLVRDLFIEEQQRVLAELWTRNRKIILESKDFVPEADDA